MPSLEDLRNILRQIDGRSYPAYKDLRGQVFQSQDSHFELCIDHVQGDPFASPSHLRIRLFHDSTKFPDWSHSCKSRRIGLENFLARAMTQSCHQLSTRAGSGKSGLLTIDAPGQEVIERTALLYFTDRIEARLSIGLPAKGRRIAGREAARMLCDQLPQLALDTLQFAQHDSELVRQAVEINEDADALRGQLKQRGLVSFIANGSILPRRSGIDQLPLDQSHATSFQSPESLSVTLDTPNQGKVTGLGIKEGITLIVGGGFHGKSTLLNAIERGVYNHRPQDGREFVITRPDAVKIRAEDGRSISGVNISPFINNLPNQSDTSHFSTENASGSTSQAANIIEALESGADALLIDEDIAATNFMIRDLRMQELIAPDKEPITPYICKVSALHQQRGVSSILVMGGSGDYFPVADTVIGMDQYLPCDLTQNAQHIVQAHQMQVVNQASTFGESTQRYPQKSSIDPRQGRREVSSKSRSTHHIQIGEHDIDLSALTQIISSSQTRAIAAAILYAHEHRLLDGQSDLPTILDLLCQTLENQLEALSCGQRGDLATFRRHELAAAFNRLRTLKIEP
ncbi:MAG: ABC-ATPase domain-containing protein [Verrucomicrobiales bacterium]|nr:ABC-ATPase domain-containing protein [Verrucomicrobiales bacterium]